MPKAVPDKVVARKYISADTAEKTYGPSKWTFRKWAYTGVIPSTKAGKLLLFSVDEIEAFLAKNTRPALEQR
jgi:hypothetical protein